MQSLTNAAANINDSKQLNVLDKKFKVLKSQYYDNSNKVEKQSINIEKFYTDAIKDMRTLQEKFEKLLAKTEQKAETVKDEDLKNMESIATTCNIIVEQINKISSNLDKMQVNTENEKFFISIKRAESQLKSFEERLFTLETDNTIQEYTFEPEKKLNVMLDELKMLGKFAFSNSTNSAPMPKHSTSSATKNKHSTSTALISGNSSSSALTSSNRTSFEMPMLKTPVFIKDIDFKYRNIRCSTLLQNKQLLLTEVDTGTVKLIDTKQNNVVSELKLPQPCDATRVKTNEVAITCSYAKKIQFVSVSSDKISKGREMSVDGICHGIEYNDQNDTLIVTYSEPPKVEILSMTGKVIKRFDKDANGARLFTWPWYVALNYDKSMIYVTEGSPDSVTLMSLTGDVKAIYKDKALLDARGVCVNRSGIVYVMGWKSRTIHQIVPGSDKLELLLDKKNGLKDPWTITYCDDEDKLYVGQVNRQGVKIFKMR